MRSLNVFDALLSMGFDVLAYVFQWINIQGPHVRLIEGDPSSEQKAAVTAVAGPGLEFDERTKSWEYVGLNEKEYKSKGEAECGALDIDIKIPSGDLLSCREPDLSVYHILVQQPDFVGDFIYQIGFCQKLVNGNLSYQIRTINPESALFRYLKEDLQNPNSFRPSPYSQLFCLKNSTQRVSKDRLLLQLLEAEIRAAGGLVQPHLRNRKRLAMVSRNTYRIMNGLSNHSVEAKICRYDRQLMSGSIKCRVLEDALHHIAYGEEAKVLKIIKMDFSLLLFHLKAPVTFCAPEIHCPKITAFGLAFLLGDWFLLKKIVQAIESSNELIEGSKLAYKLDLLHQLEEIEEKGCKVIFDNLLNKGVQILDADLLEENPGERKRYEADVVNRNSYHLIIKTSVENKKRHVISCVLGYKDPQTGMYAQKKIDPEEELFKVVALELYDSLKSANDGHGIDHEHFFTRSNRDLTLVRKILEKLKVTARCEKILKPQDFKSLLNYLNKRIRNFGYWPDGYLREQWYGEIFSELRMLPPLVWQYCLSDENPWSLHKPTMKTFINSMIRPAGDKNFYKEFFFPLSSSLGDRFMVGPYPMSPEAPDRLECLVTIYLEIREARTSELKDVLAGLAEFDSTPNVCRLM